MSENTLKSRLDITKVSFYVRNNKSALIVCDGVVYQVVVSGYKPDDLIKGVLLRSPDITLEVSQSGLESLFEDIDKYLPNSDDI
jgi:hypothetical protein